MRKKLLIIIILLVGVITEAYLLFPVLSACIQENHSEGNVSAISLQKTHKPASYGTSVGTKGMHPGKFVLNSTLNDARPNEILVYRPLSTNISHEIFLELAKKFGVTGPIQWGDDISSIQEKGELRDSMMIENHSGHIEYTHYSNYRASAEKQPKLPSDEDAIQIARGYLEERDLMPEGAIPKIYYGNSWTMFPNGTDVHWHDEIVVQFIRVSLDDIPFRGADRAELEIGNNGEILTYWSLWRPYEPYKLSAIKSPSEAFEELETQGLFNGQKIAIVPDTAVINNVHLAYHSKAAAEKEYYLEPVYVFEGTCIGHSDNESRVVR